jgi:redox-sensitive bicupin YhaK (pirin superfamily)
LQVWDVRLDAGATATLPAADGWTTALVILRGTVTLGDATRASEGQLVLLERHGTGFHFTAHDAALVLVLSGEPIDEPVVGHGPFVMNSDAEIAQAVADFNSGRFGHI